jgi:Papain family cysteine protease
LIKPVVDLRHRFLPVRHQGRRSSCLAFAASTGHELLAAADEHFCVEYLFFHAVSRTHGKNPALGTTIAATAGALLEEGQPTETAWPYTPDPVTPWTPPTIISRLHRATLAPGMLGFDGVVDALDAGTPVVLGLVITDAFFRPDASGAVADVAPDIERGGHAVLTVGHGIDADGSPALLIRNSWSDAWGLGGHAWLPRTYVQRQLHETAMLI